MTYSAILVKALVPGLFVLLGGRVALANTISATGFPVSIVNEVFGDSNSVVSVVCYNGGGSQGPNGLNCNPPGFALQPSVFVGQTGTIDTNGHAISASEQLNMSTADGQTAQAFSSADLTTGTLKGLTSGSTGAEGVSNVSLTDNVHFVVAGAGASTVTAIQVTWLFDGTLSGPFLGFQGAPVAADSVLQLGGQVSASEQIFGGPPQLTVGQSGWASFNFISQTPSLVEFTGTYDLVGPSATLPFSLSLSTFASNGDTADFSQTSQVGLILPAGVSFTSDSGAFLTATAAPTPEPSPFVAVALALCVLGFARYRRIRA